MSTPQAKRRRLNDASTTLRKPFKSPFRTPLKPSTLSSDPPSSDPPETATPAPTPVPALSLTATPKPYTPHVLTSSVPRPLATPSRPPSKKPSPSLTREIIALRSDIQILSQAHTLATSTKDEDLTRLVDTWRFASRAAAEELFAGTRDRVNRMGGVAGWKQREREQREWRAKMDREAEEAEREKREAENEERDGEKREYSEYDQYDHADAQEKEDEPEEIGGNDDDSFTMDMMLKTLNVDLKLIGYSKEAQRWDG